jgi:hypothetical protein
MKMLARLCVVFVGMVGMAAAQAPANAPAGSTGICKDGTYTKATSKMAACFGHKGVQTFYADAKTPSAMPAPTAGSTAAVPAPKPTTSAPAVMPAPTMTKQGPAAVAAAKPQAAGGKPGTVWLNTDSNVYHCYGTTYYGKTKQGAYMTEAEAKSKGAHGNRGSTCEGK